MEDVQPNERRLARKGSTTIPRVRAVRTPYHSPRSHPANATRGIRARPFVKARESDQPGPSRSRPYSHRRPSGLSVQRHPVESQTVHSSPIPRHPPPIHAATPPECIIDLTDNFRWSAFRSGQVDIYLPRQSRTFPSETETGPRPSIQQESAQVINQPGNISIVPNILHSAQHSLVIPTRSMGDFWISDSPSNQLDVLEAVPSCDYSMVLEDHARFFPDCNSSTRGSIFKLPLSLGPYDKPRRVLCSQDSAYVVTAHGVVDQVGAADVLQLDRHIRTPSLPLEEAVDDACILSHHGDSIVILGHAREQSQLTVLDLGHNQAPRHIELYRDRNTAKKPGVSAVTTLMSPLKFVSGGHDHRVHLWDITHDLSGASGAELAIKHSSIIHSLLAIMDTSHKLVSVGADRDAPIYDMSAERVARTLKMSTIPYHAHKTDSPFCTLFEVAHLETQFEVHDHRYPHQIVKRFGFITEERRGRYEKADTWSHFVACGDKNGVLRVWDLRNVSTAVAIQPCFNDPVVQVVNTGSRLLVCSKMNELACIDFSLGWAVSSPHPT